MPMTLPTTTMEVPADLDYSVNPLGDPSYGEEVTWDSGWADLVAIGDFDSGTVTVEMSCDAGLTWFTAKDKSGNALTLTANSMARVEYGGNPLLRTKLTGTSGATDVALTLFYGAELAV